MPKIHKAPFPQSVKRLRGRVAAATAAPYTTTANMVQATAGGLAYTAPAEGGLLSSLQATPRNTCGATALYLFMSEDGGATRDLIATGTAPAYAQTTGAAPTPAPLTFVNGASEYLIPANATFYWAAGVALADGWDFSGVMREY